MKLFRHKAFAVFVLVLVVLLGFVLRFNNLYTWPREGATFDEYAWTWQGMNLIQKGVPASWSPHLIYKNEKYITYRKAAFRIVTPYLEHPPLFGLVVGSFALFNGAKDMYHINLQTIRPLAVILGLASILLVYLLVSEVYDRKTALISSLLYATIPTIVVGSRIVQNENFFVPMWLLALFFVSKYLRTKKIIFRNLCAIICGLLILAKIPWIAAAGSIILIFMYLKKYQDLLRFLIIVVPIALLYVVYGFYYDGHLFFNLFGFQLNRYNIGFTSIFALFQKPYLVDRFLTDGWIYFGWFALLLLFTDIKKHFVILFAFLSYFVVFLAGIPDEAGHGWYRYPFYPFLIIATVLFVKDYFVKNPILTFLFLVIVGTTLFQLTWAVVFGFSYLVFRILIILWGLSLAPIFLNSKTVGRFSKVLNYAWLTIFIVLNIASVMLYNEQ